MSNLPLGCLCWSPYSPPEEPRAPQLLPWRLPGACHSLLGKVFWPTKKSPNNRSFKKLLFSTIFAILGSFCILKKLVPAVCLFLEFSDPFLWFCIHFGDQIGSLWNTLTPIRFRSRIFANAGNFYMSLLLQNIGILTMINAKPPSFKLQSLQPPRGLSGWRGAQTISSGVQKSKMTTEKREVPGVISAKSPVADGMGKGLGHCRMAT